MDESNDMEARLWEYIDGFSDAEERSVIDRLIAENSEWRAKYAELLQFHQAINLTELEQPSMRFAKNVMEEIGKMHVAPAARQYINNRIVWGIGAFFIVMLIGSLIYGLGQIDWSVANDPKSSWGINLSRVDYSKIFSSTIMNVVMMLNVILGLFLLDRYLANKRKKLVETINGNLE